MTKSKPWRRFLPILLAVLLALGIALYASPMLRWSVTETVHLYRPAPPSWRRLMARKPGPPSPKRIFAGTYPIYSAGSCFPTPPHGNRRSPGGPPQVCHADHRYLHGVCGRDPLGHRYHSLLHSKRRRHNPRQRVTHSFGSHFPQRRSDLTEESIPTATPCPRQGVIFGKPREKCMPPLVSPRVLWHSEYGILSAQGKEGCYAV